MPPDIVIAFQVHVIVPLIRPFESTWSQPPETPAIEASQTTLLRSNFSQEVSWPYETGPGQTEFSVRAHLKSRKKYPNPSLSLDRCNP